MSDVEKETKKRGRPAGVEKRARGPSPIKKDEKSTTNDVEIPAKRGRGRPKGSTKKNGGTKKGTSKTSGRGRGRPAKKKADSTEEENETEENEDDNESGSD